MTTNSSLIHCENLVKIYKVDELEVVALQGLDLEIADGEFLAIVGASGSGKSSLLNMLGGLDRPSAGRITVAGQNLLLFSDKELARYRREQVGFVWQQTSRNLIPYLTALENVELPMMMAGPGMQALATANQSAANDNTAKDATAYARELLDAVELTARSHHTLAQLSGGQQQRVAIAVALANRPRLLLADEPTGEVDTATAHQIWRVLRNLNERYGLTTVIVSHDRAIAHVVDRVVHIRDGKTSAETVRQQQTVTGSASNFTIQQDADLTGYFEERTVLDGAGRLQLPRDYLIQRNIQTRARVQLVDEGILIRPIDEEQRDRDHMTMIDAGFAAMEAGSNPRLPMAPADSRFLVEAVNLSRTYRAGAQEVHALRAVNLAIGRGEFVIFRGRSGSGKTTLLNLIGGLDRPTAGHVSLLGERLDKLSDAALTLLRQERIGFVFQAFSLMPTFSALENVEMLLRARQVDEEIRYARAMYCLTLVGLRRWADHRPFELSGGQQQRLSIARALAHQPTLLIADEPTSDLDSETGAQMLQLFRQLVHDEGITIVMSSHDPMSTDYGSRIYELHDGEIVSQHSLR